MGIEKRKCTANRIAAIGRQLDNKDSMSITLRSQPDNNFCTNFGQISNHHPDNNICANFGQILNHHKAVLPNSETPGILLFRITFFFVFCFCFYTSQVTNLTRVKLVNTTPKLTVYLQQLGMSIVFIISYKLTGKKSSFLLFSVKKAPTVKP